MTDFQKQYALWDEFLSVRAAVVGAAVLPEEQAIAVAALRQSRCHIHFQSAHKW